MTDGESNDRGYEDLIARMRPSQITLSTLAIGSDADTRLLAILAHLGGGRYYFTERSTQIPRIASKETSILTRNAVVEGQVAAVVADPSPILRSISGDLPPLVRLRGDHAQGPRGDGAGDRARPPAARALAVRTGSRGGLDVRGAAGLGQRLGASGQTRRSSGRRRCAGRCRRRCRRTSSPSVQVGPDGRQVSLSVQALGDDGRFADLQDTRATVMSPDGSARELALPQRGPGAYALDTRVGAPGVYRVLFQQGQREEVAAFQRARRGGAPLGRHERGAAGSAGDLERRPLAARRQPTSRAGRRAGPGVLTLWPWLLLAAAVAACRSTSILRRRA